MRAFLELDSLQLKNKLVSALWWSDDVMDQNCCYELKYIFGVSLLQFQNIVM